MFGAGGRAFLRAPRDHELKIVDLVISDGPPPDQPSSFIITIASSFSSA